MAEANERTREKHTRTESSGKNHQTNEERKRAPKTGLFSEALSVGVLVLLCIVTVGSMSVSHRLSFFLSPSLSLTSPLCICVQCNPICGIYLTESCPNERFLHWDEIHTALKQQM